MVAKDFERIINENTNLSSVVAFGGEEAVSVHGKVYIAIEQGGMHLQLH